MNEQTQQPRRRKCILTFARSWNGLAATRCLGKHGIQVITGDTNACAAASFSRYSIEHFTYPSPDENPQGFIDTLIAVVQKHTAPDTDLVLMPLHTDTYTIVRHQERLAEFVRMALPTKDQFRQVGNKTRLARLCQQHNITIPPTLVVEHREEFFEKCIEFSYPAFLKVPTATAAIGLHKVNSPDEAIKTFVDMCNSYTLTKAGQFPILQSSIDGEDYCATFLFDHGTVRAAMTYHNLLEYPRKSGMGILRETVNAPEIEDIGRKLLSTLQWHGVAEIDFRYDGVSTPWLIEVNPRFWGGLLQCIEAGIPYPHLVYQLAVAGHIDDFKPATREVRTWNPGLTMMLALQEYLDDRRPLAEIGRAYTQFQHEFKQDQLKAIMKLVGSLGTAFNPGERVKAIEKILKESKAVNEFFTWDDPLPLLGLMYPLMVFIQHGKITPELLISKAKIEDDEPEGVSAE